MTEPVLRVNELTVDFPWENGTLRAVDAIGFQVFPGETVGIVGESGSGKSVTALSVMKLVPQPGRIVSGEIIFRNQQQQQDLLKLPPGRIRKYRGNELAMIFQEPMTSLNPVLSCGFQVAESLRLHLGLSARDARNRTIALFKEVLLPRPEALYDAYPHELSGGQKQRVMIAMAMACNPHILFADEPTTALDVTVQQTILELMKSLQAKFGMSIVFITHDLGLIAGFADRVLVMQEGKIVEEGPVNELFANPQHPYTKGLLACRPPLDRRLRRLPVIQDFMESGSFSPVNDPALVIPDAERKTAHEKLFAQAPLLEIKNLSTWFSQRSGFFSFRKEVIKAVDDVSFDVYPGETLGLVGESGCGKTTLGRSILRLIEPTSGTIIYKGRDLTKLSQQALRPLRKKLQIIFQDPYSSLNPRMTVGEAILEPMRVHRLLGSEQERKKKVFELLDKVNLAQSHFYRYPHEFSGGQRQRICIARVLALQPEFIICDESVSALDVSVQAQVLNLLNDLKRDFGFTYIFISHDLGVVKYMADRMIVMKNGRIEEAGEADEVYSHPRSEYTLSLIRSIPKGQPGKSPVDE